MAEASAVISTRRDECSVGSTDTPENPRVRMTFGDVSVFFDPDAAHEIGAKLIAVAATISSAFNPSLAFTGRDPQDEDELEELGGEGEPITEAVA